VNLCPITMREHRAAPTCDRCAGHVARYLAWFDALEPRKQTLRANGAWFANDTTHTAAMELRHTQTQEIPA
jgi:hypothetical protein